MTQTLRFLRAADAESAEAGDVGPGGPLDLSVTEAEEEGLTTGRYAVWVDVRLPEGARLHGAVRPYIRRHLRGRNPVVFEEQGHLRVGFAVRDHSPETMRQVDHFAVAVGRIFGTDDAFCTPVEFE